MLVRMDLTLPRDARFVGTMREVAGCILHELRAPEEAVDDVKLAVTEACANAVRHAVGTAEYSVRVHIGRQTCEIEILDTGPGFVPTPDDARMADPESESGRGLHLIRALVDDCEFRRDGEANTVRLVKRWEREGLPTGDEGLPADLRSS